MAGDAIAHGAAALRRLLKEPLIRFAVLGLLIFAVNGLVNRAASPPPDKIVVTSPKIEQLASLFANTWQRPPSAAELKGLIDDYVKEEIYVREAVKLGIDQDDSVIRRRLRQKMEFFDDDLANSLAPTDDELETYLRTHSAGIRGRADAGFSTGLSQSGSAWRRHEPGRRFGAAGAAREHDGRSGLARRRITSAVLSSAHRQIRDCPYFRSSFCRRDHRCAGGPVDWPDKIRLRSAYRPSLRAEAGPDAIALPRFAMMSCVNGGSPSAKRSRSAASRNSSSTIR